VLKPPSLIRNVLLTLIPLATLATTSLADSLEFQKWAATPPMGWNSWDCFGTAVTEEQTRANADYMAAHLKQHGWQYIVVDIQWYEPQAKGWEYRKDALLTMDLNGRLTPAANRFSSAANGAGFKPLADYIHSLGLKFGIHILRGIPRQAVFANTPILNLSTRAADIADKNSTCQWNGDMYGVDTTKPGAQEYYDSLLALYASWDVDFIKVDDLSRPYRASEIEAIRKAIDNCGRPIVFSTSPGATPLEEGKHIASHANMWRMSDDFWDQWQLLKDQFKRCADWAPYCDAGHFPDADMLPIGAILASNPDGHTHFTHDEQYTLMTLWSMARSPLIFGGNLPATDDFTLSLITNDEVIAVDQRSTPGKQLFRRTDLIVWVADVPNSNDKYLAVFNAQNHQNALADTTAEIPVNLKDVGFEGPAKIRDLWKHADIGTFNDHFAPAIPFHGAGLYRLTPQ
jgi:alpha-galactosidase